MSWVETAGSLSVAPLPHGSRGGTAYGSVGGSKVHKVQDYRDCSKPCLFLEGGRCRIMGTDRPKCLFPDDIGQEDAQIANVKKKAAAAKKKRGGAPLPWSPEERALALDGSLSCREVAAATGRSVKAVSQMRVKLRDRGHDIPHDAWRKPISVLSIVQDGGEIFRGTVYECAERMGVSKSAVYAHARDKSRGNWAAIKVGSVYG